MKIIIYILLLVGLSTTHTFSATPLVVEYREAIKQLNTGVKNLKGYKHYKVKVTFYVPSAGGINTEGDGKKTAIGGRPIPGRTIAVSRNLKHLLRRSVYVKGRGMFYANDLLAKSYKGKEIRNQIDICLGSLEEVPKQGVFRDVSMLVKI